MRESQKTVMTQTEKETREFVLDSVVIALTIAVIVVGFGLAIDFYFSDDTAAIKNTSYFAIFMNASWMTFGVRLLFRLVQMSRVYGELKQWQANTPTRIAEAVEINRLPDKDDSAFTQPSADCTELQDDKDPSQPEKEELTSAQITDQAKLEEYKAIILSNGETISDLRRTSRRLITVISSFVLVICRCLALEEKNETGTKQEEQDKLIRDKQDACVLLLKTLRDLRTSGEDVCRIFGKNLALLDDTLAEAIKRGALQKTELFVTSLQAALSILRIAEATKEPRA